MRALPRRCKQMGLSAAVDATFMNTIEDLDSSIVNMTAAYAQALTRVR